MTLTIQASIAGVGERIPLWGNSFYGMSLKEVLSIEPNAKVLPNNVNPSLLNPDALALAKLDNIEIAGENFSAWYIFNNGKLSQVSLTLVSKMSGSNASPNDYLNALYSHFTLLLSVKYGNSIKKTWQDFAPANVHLWNTQWALGLTSIDLYVEKAQLEITYTAQYADDLRKL
jgi:hypothetical protein